jgi:hypothetical protein
MDITDINNLIYTAVTIITLTMNQHSKRSKIEECKVLDNENAEIHVDKQLEKSYPY